MNSRSKKIDNDFAQLHCLYRQALGLAWPHAMGDADWMRDLAKNAALATQAELRRDPNLMRRPGAVNNSLMRDIRRNAKSQTMFNGAI